MTLKFNMTRETKNTIRFDEITSSPDARPVIGPLYVSKTSLGSLNWTNNKVLTVTLGAEDA